MIAQTSLSPYMHSPVSSYQVGLFSYTDFSLSQCQEFIFCCFSCVTVHTIKHISYAYMHLMTSFLIYRYTARPGCTISHTSCSQLWVSVLHHLPLLFYLFVTVYSAVAVLLWLNDVMELMTLVIHTMTLLFVGVFMQCTGYSSYPNNGSCHVHPAHLHDGTSHPAAKPPVSGQHRHSQYHCYTHRNCPSDC